MWGIGLIADDSNEKRLLLLYVKIESCILSMNVYHMINIKIYSNLGQTKVDLTLG